MRNHILLLAVLLVATTTALAEDKPSGKTLAATKDIYAFPKKEQAATQQSKDEATCYGWAVTNTGSDSGSVIWVGTATAENHEDPDTKTV